MTKAQRMKRRRIIMRRRIFVVGIFYILVIGMCIYNSVSRSIRLANAEYINHIVSTGETLWGIANKYSDDSIDTRDVIHEIRKVNHLDDATIYCGDNLLVPVCNR